MEPWAAAHVCAVTFWFGIVGCEFVIERSRTESKLHGFAVARNHFWIDLLLELPAAGVVLATGIVMVGDVAMTPLLVTKIGAGLTAVAVNVACVVPVTLRRRAANGDHLEDVIRHSRSIDRLSAIGVPAAVLALLLGVSLPA